MFAPDIVSLFDGRQTFDRSPVSLPTVGNFNIVDYCINVVVPVI